MVTWSTYIGRRGKNPVEIIKQNKILTYTQFIRYCDVRGLHPAPEEEFKKLLDQLPPKVDPPAIVSPLKKPKPQAVPKKAVSKKISTRRKKKEKKETQDK